LGWYVIFMASRRLLFQNTRCCVPFSRPVLISTRKLRSRQGGAALAKGISLYYTYKLRRMSTAIRILPTYSMHCALLLKVRGRRVGIHP
jgi:hypothetical protein